MKTKANVKVKSKLKGGGGDDGFGRKPVER